MSHGNNPARLKSLVTVKIGTLAQSNGVLGWIRFKSLNLHQRGSFAIESKEGYRKQAGDTDLMEDLTTRLLQSDIIVAPRIVMSAGALNEIGFLFQICPPSDTDPLKSEILEIVGPALVSAKYAFKFM